MKRIVMLLPLTLAFRAAAATHDGGPVRGRQTPGRVLMVSAARRTIAPMIFPAS